MSELPIRIYPDPTLRSKCLPVEEIDETKRRLALDMIDTMHKAPGVGLAAPQVGEKVRLIVADLSIGEDPGQLHVLFNPVIETTAPEMIEAEEGCLSLPEVLEKVARSERVRVRAINLEGKQVVLEAQGKLARVLQHEVDHLDGKLILDHLNRMKREVIKRRLKKRTKNPPVVSSTLSQ